MTNPLLSPYELLQEARQIQEIFPTAHFLIDHKIKKFPIYPRQNWQKTPLNLDTDEDKILRMLGAGNLLGIKPISIGCIVFDIDADNAEEYQQASKLLKTELGKPMLIVPSKTPHHAHFYYLTDDDIQHTGDTTWEFGETRFGSGQIALHGNAVQYLRIAIQLFSDSPLSEEKIQKITQSKQFQTGQAEFKTAHQKETKQPTKQNENGGKQKWKKEKLIQMAKVNRLELEQTKPGQRHAEFLISCRRNIQLLYHIYEKEVIQARMCEVFRKIKPEEKNPERIFETAWEHALQSPEELHRPLAEPTAYPQKEPIDPEEQAKKMLWDNIGRHIFLHESTYYNCVDTDTEAVPYKTNSTIIRRAMSQRIQAEFSFTKEMQKSILAQAFHEIEENNRCADADFLVFSPRIIEQGNARGKMLNKWKGRLPFVKDGKLIHPDPSQFPETTLYRLMQAFFGEPAFDCFLHWLARGWYCAFQRNLTLHQHRVMFWIGEKKSGKGTISKLIWRKLFGLRHPWDMKSFLLGRTDFCGDMLKSNVWVAHDMEQLPPISFPCLVVQGEKPSSLTASAPVLSPARRGQIPEAGN